MKNLISISLVLLLGLTSCGTEDLVTTDIQDKKNSSSATFKIMALGASRVEGARPEYESYRYELWKKLVDGKHSFDLIGTQLDDAPYPTHNGLKFDGDHQGWGGRTSGEILSMLQASIDAAGAPDIVLFSTPGGNDALQDLSYDQAVVNSNLIIDMLQKANSNVTIIIEQPAPAHSSMMDGHLITFWTDMKAEVLNLAAKHTTSTSKVYTVDMSTGFGDQHLADDVHYNEASAEFIAARYYEKLVTLLN